MKVLIMVLTILLSTILNAQSIIHFGVGMGQYGGATTTPYDNPTSNYAGINLDLEYELFIYNLQSISFFSKYAHYDKSGKEPNESNSNVFSLGVSYNITNTFISNGFIVQFSPILSYGFEKIEWQNEYPDPNWYGLYVNVKGDDAIGYASFGFVGGFGIRMDKMITKLNVSYIKSHIIHHERTLSHSADEFLYYEEPEYKSVPHSQIRLSVGYFL